MLFRSHERLAQPESLDSWSNDESDSPWALAPWGLVVAAPRDIVLRPVEPTRDVRCYMTDSSRQHLLLAAICDSSEDVETAGIFAEGLAIILPLVGCRCSSRCGKLELLDLLPIVTLGGGVGR